MRNDYRWHYELRRKVAKVRCAVEVVKVVLVNFSFFLDDRRELLIVISYLSKRANPIPLISFYLLNAYACTTEWDLVYGYEIRLWFVCKQNWLSEEPQNRKELTDRSNQYIDDLWFIKIHNRTWFLTVRGTVSPCISTQHVTVPWFQVKSWCGFRYFMYLFLWGPPFQSVNQSLATCRTPYLHFDFPPLCY